MRYIVLVCIALFVLICGVTAGQGQNYGLVDNTACGPAFTVPVPKACTSAKDSNGQFTPLVRSVAPVVVVPPVVVAPPVVTYVKPPVYLGTFMDWGDGNLVPMDTIVTAVAGRPFAMGGGSILAASQNARAAWHATRANQLSGAGAYNMMRSSTYGMGYYSQPSYGFGFGMSYGGGGGYPGGNYHR